MSVKRDVDRTPSEWARIQSVGIAPTDPVVERIEPTAEERDGAPFLAGLTGYDAARTSAYDWWAR